MVDKIKELSDTAVKEKYYAKTIPSKIDISIDEILQKLIKLKKDELLRVIEKAGDDIWIFHLFSERKVTIAVRNKSPKEAKTALFSLAIASYGVNDFREILISLSLVCDGIVRVGGVCKEVFDEIDAIIELKPFIKSFLDREEKDKSIEAMGYEALEDTNGFLYRQKS